METIEQILERQCAEFKFKDGKVNYFSVSTQHSIADTIDDAVEHIIEADKEFGGKSFLAYWIEKIEKEQELNPYYGQISPEEMERIIEEFNSIPEVYPIPAEDLKKILERSKNG